MPTSIPELRRRTALLAACTIAAGLSACGGGNRYQGMEAEQIFRIASTEYDEGKYGNAIDALDRLLVSHGDWDRVPEARLMLGEAYFADGDYLTARSEFGRFLDRYAGHPRSAEAALGICRSLAELAPKPQRDQGYTQEAMMSCRNVVVDFAGREEAAQAALVSNQLRQTLAEKEYLTGDFYYRRNLFDSAIKYYEFVINLYPESEFAPDALLGVYKSNLMIGYEDLAEEARQRLLLEYPDSDAADEVRLDESGR
jgi:outer membrane protein assembly factor BamD